MKNLRLNCLFFIAITILMQSCSSGSDDDTNAITSPQSQKIKSIVGSRYYENMKFFYDNNRLHRVLNFGSGGDALQLFYNADKLSYAKHDYLEDDNFDLNSCEDCSVYDFNYNDKERISSIYVDDHPVMEYDYDGKNLKEYRYYSYPGSLNPHRIMRFTYSSNKLTGYSMTENYSGTMGTTIYTVIVDNKKNPFYHSSFSALDILEVPSIYGNNRLPVNQFPNNILQISESDGNNIFKVVYQYNENDYPIAYELYEEDYSDSGVFNYEAK